MHVHSHDQAAAILTPPDFGVQVRHEASPHAVLNCHERLTEHYPARACVMHLESGAVIVEHAQECRVWTTGWLPLLGLKPASKQASKQGLP